MVSICRHAWDLTNLALLVKTQAGAAETMRGRCLIARTVPFCQLVKCRALEGIGFI